MSFLAETREEIGEHQDNIEEMMRGFFCDIERLKHRFESNERSPEHCFGHSEVIIDEVFYLAQNLKNVHELWNTAIEYRKKVWKLTSEDS